MDRQKNTYTYKRISSFIVCLKIQGAYFNVGYIVKVRNKNNHGSVQQLWETVWSCLKKYKEIRTTVWSRNATSRYVPKGNKITVLKIPVLPCSFQHYLQ